MEMVVRRYAKPKIPIAAMEFWRAEKLASLRGSWPPALRARPAGAIAFAVRFRRLAETAASKPGKPAMARPAPARPGDFVTVYASAKRLRRAAATARWNPEKIVR